MTVNAMDKSDLTRYKAITRQALKSLCVAMLTLPITMLLVSAALVGAIGSLAGQSGIEVALAFVGDATAPAMMALLKFALPAYFFIAAIYFAFSWERWTETHLRQLTVRLQTKITGLARLWASILSCVATPLYLPNASCHRIAHASSPIGARTPYLAGEAPQLE